MDEIIRKCLPTYEIERKLGEGVYGSVYQVKDSLKNRAVKVVPLFVERSLSLKTSAEMGLKLSSDFHSIRDYYNLIKGPGVIEIYDFHLVESVVTERNARGYLVVLMELCSGNLSDYIIDYYPLPFDQIVTLMRQLAVVLGRLSICREQSFLITDLKPSNLLINGNGELVVGDLGGVKRLDSVSTTAHSQFTPNWSAPEIIVRGMTPSVASVIFSFGLISYFMIEGRLPYEDLDFLERIQRLKNGAAAFTRDEIPYSIRNLIHTCLQYVPETRWKDFQTVIDLLSAGEKSAAGSGSRSLQLKPTGDGANDSRELCQSSQTACASKENRFWCEPLSGMEFVWVPGGSFIMGGRDGDNEGFENEFPHHKVILSGFWMGKYPVTQKMWECVMKSNPSYFQCGGQYPVEQVSWHEAVKFCSILTDVTQGREIFCLPTEAQWEYAARAGGVQDHKYSGDDDIEAVAWYLSNAEGMPQPVGKKAANALGLFDMSGNVWEWCQDVYRADAYAVHKLKDPLCDDRHKKWRVNRGGCWFSLSSGCRVAKRSKSPEDHKNNNIGFRVIRIQLDEDR